MCLITEVPNTSCRLTQCVLRPSERLTPRNCPLLTNQSVSESQPWFEMLVRIQEITRDLSGTSRFPPRPSCLSVFNSSPSVDAFHLSSTENIKTKISTLLLLASE